MLGWLYFFLMHSALLLHIKLCATQIKYTLFCFSTLNVNEKQKYMLHVFFSR